jgi:hypothetical protein
MLSLWIQTYTRDPSEILKHFPHTFLIDRHKFPSQTENLHSGPNDYEPIEDAQEQVRDIQSLDT